MAPPSDTHRAEKQSREAEKTRKESFASLESEITDREIVSETFGRTRHFDREPR